MAEKQLNARIVNKSDTSTNWGQATFIPKKGEILHFSDLDKIKIGDGEHNPSQLPFIDKDKQDTLVSGTNIKTINGSSILGSGDLEVTVDVSGKMDKVNPTGSGSISVGRLSGTTPGNNSVTLGNNAEARGQSSIALGDGARAFEDYSTAIGYKARAEANHAYAEGFHATASGVCSHAEGGKYSSGMIVLNTSASGESSHAEGMATWADGIASHSEGNQTIATGDNSHSEGLFTEAQRKSQHVEGEYNIADTGGTDETTRGNYIHIAGNGTSTTRSNAHTLDWLGNAWYQGDVYVGGTNQTTGSSKLATETYVNTGLSGKADTSHTHTKSQITDFPSLATVATSGSYNDLSNKPSIPTKTSDLTNDSGFLTSHQDISGKENTSNKVTSISASSTDSQYPSAKCMYTMIGNVESVLTELIGG